MKALEAINNNRCPVCDGPLIYEMDFRDSRYKMCRKCGFSEFNLTLIGQYLPGCIRTFSGRYINILAPAPSDFIIEDIAHALSQQMRFAGHLAMPYSVAQHSVLASHCVTGRHRLAALLHDASEAYLCDVPAPIKAAMPDYKRIEKGVMWAIAQRFSFEWPLSAEVKEADEFLLGREWEALVVNRGWCLEPPIGVESTVLWAPASPKAAERMFLQRFDELKNNK